MPIHSRFESDCETVIIEFSGKVDKAQAEASYERLKNLVPPSIKKFKMLTDFTNVERMDYDIRDIIKVTMDYFNERGVTEILRIIPDPAKDIGFNIMSAFHYSSDVKIMSFVSRQEAMAHLYPTQKLDASALNDSVRLAFENKITFPEAVKKMAGAGVERYCADLSKLEKFIYSPAGECCVVALPLTEVPLIAQNFSQNAVKAAIKDIQSGQIGYAEFLRRIMRAGVVYYDAFIHGQRVIYTGRNGDFHVEPFVMWHNIAQPKDKT